MVYSAGGKLDRGGSGVCGGGETFVSGEGGWAATEGLGGEAVGVIKITEIDQIIAMTIWLHTKR